MKLKAPAMWKQSGSIYLWRYAEKAENYPGWNLAMDQAGYASLIDLLRKFASEPMMSLRHRTIRIEPPSVDILAIPNNPGASIVAAEKLRITLSLTLDEWMLEEMMPVVQLTLGRGKISSMIAWLVDIDRAFDTSFGGSPQLWSWGILK